MHEVQLPGAALFLTRGRDCSEALIAEALTIRYGDRARDWQFSRTPFGAPTIDAPPPGVHISISRTDDIQIVALAASRIGVDVETSTRIALNAHHEDAWLSKADRRFLRDCPSCKTSEIAARWVLREAYGKALGVGLALPLDGLTFVRSETGELHLLERPATAHGWSFGLHRFGELIIGIASPKT